MPAKHRRIWATASSAICTRALNLSRLFQKIQVFSRKTRPFAIFFINCSVIFRFQKRRADVQAPSFRSAKYTNGIRQFLRHLLLRIGFAIHQPITHPNNRCLPPLETLIHELAMLCRLTRRSTSPCTASGFCAQHIDKRDFVALTVQANRFLQRNVALSFLTRPKAHQNFIFNTSCAICAQLRARSRFKRCRRP